MTIRDDEYYVSYYDDKGKYYSTKFFTDINTAQDAKEYYENNNFKRVEIKVFKYS